jgi:hypothetical protein
VASPSRHPQPRRAVRCTSTPLLLTQSLSGSKSRPSPVNWGDGRAGATAVRHDDQQCSFACSKQSCASSTCSALPTSCGSTPASARPSPLRRPREYGAPCAGRTTPAVLARMAAGPACDPGRVPLGHRFPQAGDLFDPGLRGYPRPRFYGSSRPGPPRPGPPAEPPGDIRRAPCGAQGRLTAAPGQPAPRTSGAVNRSSSPRSVRYMSATTATRRPAMAHDATRRHNEQTARRPRSSQARGRFAGSGRCKVRTCVG